MPTVCADRPVRVVARVVIARLQRGVQEWADADQVLPADAASLLATLEQARQGLQEAGSATVHCGIEAFREQVKALIDAEVLPPGEGSAEMEMAEAMGVLLQDIRTASGNALRASAGG